MKLKKTEVRSGKTLAALKALKVLKEMDGLNSVRGGKTATSLKVAMKLNQ